MASTTSIASPIEGNSPLLSADEYFQLEAHTEERYEFDHGKLLPMSGESIDANRIGRNCEQFFIQQLANTTYETFRLSVKLRVLESRLYRYPDVMIVPSSSIRHSHEITEPVLIMEITSGESENRDRKIKLNEYTNQFDSLRYYLIVDQYEPFVQVYSRSEDGGWKHAIFQALTDVVPLPDLGVSIPMDLMYRKVSFLS